MHVDIEREGESDRYVHVLMNTNLYIHTCEDTTFKVEKMSTTVLRSYQGPQPCFLTTVNAFLSASTDRQASSIFSGLDLISMIL